jgi:DNA gyrase subunit B
LLLTFFYRQMREVIEKGYLFIAQPPLFGVRKNKKMLYVKDQPALDSFLTENGIDGLTLQATAGPVLAGRPLYNLATRLQGYREYLFKLERRCDTRVIVAALRAGHVTPETFSDEAKLAEAGRAIEEYLAQEHPETVPVKVEVGATVNGAGNGASQRALLIQLRPGATTRPCNVTGDLVSSAEYGELTAIEEDVRSIGAAPYTARAQNAPETELRNAQEVADYVAARGRKGMQVSRYKGLGEMNADQLWETTMNPDGRTLLKVRINDDVRVDELFSVLMGDQVEPRRKFIEENALNVKNLDI